MDTEHAYKDLTLGSSDMNELFERAITFYYPEHLRNLQVHYRYRKGDYRRLIKRVYSTIRSERLARFTSWAGMAICLVGTILLGSTDLSWFDAAIISVLSWGTSLLTANFAYASVYPPVMIVYRWFKRMWLPCQKRRNRESIDRIEALRAYLKALRDRYEHAYLSENSSLQNEEAQLTEKIDQLQGEKWILGRTTGMSATVRDTERTRLNEALEEARAMRSEVRTALSMHRDVLAQRTDLHRLLIERARGIPDAERREELIQSIRDRCRMVSELVAKQRAVAQHYFEEDAELATAAANEATTQAGAVACLQPGPSLLWDELDALAEMTASAETNRSNASEHMHE